mgnify:CR=1 FL=1
MRSAVFVLMLCSMIVPLCFAEMDWAHLVLIESAVDQSQGTDLLKAGLCSVQYDSKRTVGDFLREFPERDAAIADHVARYKLDQYYLTDGTVEYGFHLPLTQSIMSLLIPPKTPLELELIVPMLCPVCDQAWPSGKQPPSGIQLKPKALERTNYTGIIIDCRDINITPCLFPVVCNEKMQEIYSINFADTTSVIERGLVIYAESEASAAPRTGDNPLKIKAVASSGDLRTDIRIPAAAAQRIHGSQNNLTLLRECRVAVLFGQ